MTNTPKPTHETSSWESEGQEIISIQLPAKQPPRTEGARRISFFMRGPVSAFLFGVIVGMGLGVALVLIIVGK